MIILILLQALVYQKGDTLFFVEKDSIIKEWVLEPERRLSGIPETLLITRAKVSDNNCFFFIYEEKQIMDIPYQSRIIFYNAARKRLFEYRSSPERIVSFRLSNVYDSLLVVLESRIDGTRPCLWTFKKKRRVLIAEDKWARIIDYKLSPNQHYLLMNTRKPYGGVSWDYIYFIDLSNKKDWQYLLPTCFSCKRTRIELKVTDQGIAEVIAKGEHRVFSVDGQLIDFFFD